MRLRFAVLGFLALLAASCASINPVTTPYLGVPKYPRSDPDKVQIIRAEPATPHDRLGEIVVDASIDPAPTAKAVEEVLRIEASRLGADAVVIVSDRVGPTSPYSAARRIVGLAIKSTPGK
jgi:hypothetical protein